MPSKLVQIKCRGRNPQGREVLDVSLDVTIMLNRNPWSGFISVLPQECPYNTGGHGQRCKASHPDQDKVGEGVVCPFSFDYPYAKEVPGWKMPSELAAAVEELER